MEVIQKQNMLCCHCTAISKLFIPPLNNTFAIKKKIKISPSRIEIKAGEWKRQDSGPNRFLQTGTNAPVSHCYSEWNGISFLYEFFYLFCPVISESRWKWISPYSNDISRATTVCFSTFCKQKQCFPLTWIFILFEERWFALLQTSNIAAPLLHLNKNRSISETKGEILFCRRMIWSRNCQNWVLKNP